MIEMFTALQAESSGVIRKLELSRIQNSPFRQYAANGIRLTITGPGKAAAAAAVGMVLGRWPKEQLPQIQLVNFGSCGGNLHGREDFAPGDSYSKEDPAAEDLNGRVGKARAEGGTGLFLINKLTDADTGRTFYPDLLLDTDLPEAALVTVSRPWSGAAGRTGPVQVFDPTQLFDMEGAAIYEAGHFFLRPDQLHFVKGVTDPGTGAGLPDREEFAQRMDAYAEQALPYLKALNSSGEYNRDQRAETRTAEEEELTASIAAAVHASATMEHEIRQLVQYGTLAGVDIRSLVPPECPDRREGKRALEQLRRTLQGIG